MIRKFALNKGCNFNDPAKTIDVTEAVREWTAMDDSGVNVADVTATCGDPAPNILKRLTIQFKSDKTEK